MKILVIGHAGHGKDTVCEMLRGEHGYSFQSSSQAAFDRVIWPGLSVFYGNKTDCWADKDNCRDIWFDLISSYNTPDASRLVRKVLETSDIYCGLRSRREFEASRHLFRHIVWVDALGRLPDESPDSMELNRTDADHIINNNFGLDSLADAVNRLAERMREDPKYIRPESDRQRLYHSHFPVA